MTGDYKKILNGENNPNYRHGLSYTKEYRLPFSRAWRKANKAKVSANNRAARAKRSNASGTYTAKDVETKLWCQDNKCYWCLEILNGYEVDHVVPLSKGGSNCKNNIVATCYLCNRQKHSSLVLDWYSKENCRATRQNFYLGKHSV